MDMRWMKDLYELSIKTLNGERASGGLEPFCRKVLRTPKTFKKGVFGRREDGRSDSHLTVGPYPLVWGSGESGPSEARSPCKVFMDNSYRAFFRHFPEKLLTNVFDCSIIGTRLMCPMPMGSGAARKIRGADTGTKAQGLRPARTVG